MHPERPGYQAGEVARFVEVYDSGLVFEQADLEKMIRTDHWMADGPGGWRSSDGSTKAGMLLSALARSDEQIRTKYEAELAKDNWTGPIRLAWLKSVSAKAPGWKRFHVADPAKVQVTGDGPPAKGLTAKLTPTGAASVYLQGGAGLPLYVDDVTVEYPKK